MHIGIILQQNDKNEGKTIEIPKVCVYVRRTHVHKDTRIAKSANRTPTLKNTHRVHGFIPSLEGQTKHTTYTRGGRKVYMLREEWWRRRKAEAECVWCVHKLFLTQNVSSLNPRKSSQVYERAFLFKISARTFKNTFHDILSVCSIARECICTNHS